MRKSIPKKTIIILIISLTIAIPICILSFSALISSTIEANENFESADFSYQAVEYLREELQMSGNITTNTDIVATKIRYFYDNNTSNKKKICQRVEITLKVGENPVELFFGFKKYIVTFEKKQSGDMEIIGYSKKQINKK